MSTVNISFNSDLLQQIDQVAQEESRSRSELIREAARTYIERKRRWAQISRSGPRLRNPGRSPQRTLLTKFDPIAQSVRSNT